MPVPLNGPFADQEVARVVVRVVLVAFVVATVLLAVTAAHVRYVAVIRARPLWFVAECAAFALIGSAPVFLMGLTRKISEWRKVWIAFAIFAAKIGVLYVLAELSGINNVVFR